MGLQHPAITARIENTKAAYLLDSFLVIQERQRPTYAEFTIKEPLDPEQTILLSLGFENKLKQKSVLRIKEFNQVTAEHFECVAVDPSYYILNDQFNEHGTRLSFEEALNLVATKYGLILDIRIDEQIFKRHNLVFLSTVRNALDQIMRIYKVQHLRYHFDMLQNKLFILPGKLPKDPFELPVEYFLEENPERGLEFKTFPEMSPFIPVTWRGKEQVVDSVEFDSEEDSMFLELVTLD